MRYFNIDLHISVIADIENIFYNLGHSIASKSLSGHTWVFDRKQDYIKLLSGGSWNRIDKNLCDEFYKEYKQELCSYDGFVCTYPPSFSLLYEKFNKPIILQVPIRFELPFQNDSKKLNWFIDFLKNGIDNGQIIPICNNLYDKEYCEIHTNREWIHIPNLCEYTNINCKGDGNNFILYERCDIDIPNKKIKNKDIYLGRKYKWDAFNNLRGVIHFPYNVSTMSIFEQYTGNVPLFVPDIDLNYKLYLEGKTFSEVGWNKTNVCKKMISLSDFYDREWMPYIYQFSSLGHLDNLLNDSDTEKCSSKMKDFNVVRKAKIYDLWKKVLENRQ